MRHWADKSTTFPPPLIAQMMMLMLLFLMYYSCRRRQLQVGAVRIWRWLSYRRWPHASSIRYRRSNRFWLLRSSVWNSWSSRRCGITRSPARTSDCASCARKSRHRSSNSRSYACCADRSTRTRATTLTSVSMVTKREIERGREKEREGQTERGLEICIQ